MFVIQILNCASQAILARIIFSALSHYLAFLYTKLHVLLISNLSLIYSDHFQMFGSLLYLLVHPSLVLSANLAAFEIASSPQGRLYPQRKLQKRNINETKQKQ